MNKPNSYWVIAHWILMPAWTIGALLTMAKVNGGFFTNYLSDLTNPPDMYIVLRGLWSSSGKIPYLATWFGQTPERTGISILLVGIISEFSQKYWKGGPFAGTFDPWDIAAFSGGLIICYFFDKRAHR